jgi:hypothetical protein
MGPSVKSQGNLFVASAAADNKKVSHSFSFYQSFSLLVVCSFCMYYVVICFS